MKGEVYTYFQAAGMCSTKALRQKLKSDKEQLKDNRTDKRRGEEGGGGGEGSATGFGWKGATVRPHRVF